ncbi:unnamed protein product [Aspergillus oryzae var. brunneus]|uniref:Unnamed protein product n=1 Tax=Aspergillus oryzae var. brunneus TaxID=332754 RepID=A0ABQ6LGH3_ASPOZ|nr:unnamed protein product [Aspergillus oryzae var. brunneus]
MNRIEDQGTTAELGSIHGGWLVWAELAIRCPGVRVNNDRPLTCRVGSITSIVMHVYCVVSLSPPHSCITELALFRWSFPERTVFATPHPSHFSSLGRPRH